MRPGGGYTVAPTPGGVVHPRKLATRRRTLSFAFTCLRFPWCVMKEVSVADGVVEVKFKPVTGREDSAGVVVWRWKNGRTYYVARANANENNVSLYYTTLGIRTTIKYVDAPVPGNVWHTLRVEFSGEVIKVSLNGKTYIEYKDNHITGPGTVGVWTKADSVTAFDGFAYGKSR